MSWESWDCAGAKFPYFTQEVPNNTNNRQKEDETRKMREQAHNQNKKRKTEAKTGL